MKRREIEQLQEFMVASKPQPEKRYYNDLGIEIICFKESFIRTSYGNDGNDDGNWDDEYTNPLGKF